LNTFGAPSADSDDTALLRRRARDDEARRGGEIESRAQFEAVRTDSVDYVTSLRQLEQRQDCGFPVPEMVKSSLKSSDSGNDF
jgi:hypothetical protein